MCRVLRYLILFILTTPLAYTQQINKVLISGNGGQHDEDVKTSFMLGYASYNGSQFSGDIFLYVNTLQASLDYAVANNYDLMIRSTTGVTTAIQLAPSYPSVKLVMPAGSNSYTQAFSGDIINSPVVVTGAGTDSNQTGYEIEFYSIDPISGSNLSSFSNGYIAGQLAFISNTFNCSFDYARSIARVKGSENGNWDFYNGFGEIQTKDVVESLPVELTSFIGIVINDNILLSWKTATEVDNYGFEVQRLQNNNNTKLHDSDLNWKKVGFVWGAGNSNSLKEYNFVDSKINSAGNYSYRLKQIDNDGTFSYSNVIEIEVTPGKYELYQNYPNPFNPTTNIKFSLAEESRVEINIYNMLGEKVIELVNGDFEAGSQQIQLNATASGLASGTYIYSIETKNFRAVKKMILMK